MKISRRQTDLILVFAILTAGCPGCGGNAKKDRDADALDTESDTPEVDAELPLDITEAVENDYIEETALTDPIVDDLSSAEDLYVEDSEEDGTIGPQFPIIFLHGLAGALGDWLETIRWMTENDPRWTGFHEAGTESHQAWEPDSIPPSYWLFDFTYYNGYPSNPAGDYTAGIGTIGSNGEFLCEPYDAAGHLPADSAAYYEEVTHEYAADLADFVGSVLAATGAEKVDIVGHSMGGMIARSYIQFHEGYTNVRRLMLVSSPIHGVPFTDLAILYPGLPRWMVDHEFTELDNSVELWDIGFHNCEIEDGPVIAWHEGLNQTDELAAEHVTYYVIVGESDEILSLANVEYRFAEWQIVVPGANHNTIRSHPETRQRILDYLGN